MRTLLSPMVGLALVAAGTSGASIICVEGDPFDRNCVIDNGLAPPNPENVIDHETYATDSLFVRNVGCPPEWPAGNPKDPCPSPGAPTAVALTTAGTVQWLEACDSSSVTMDGGHAAFALAGSDWSTVTVSGGAVHEYLLSYGSSNVTLSGGTAQNVYAYGSSTVRIDGGIVGLDVYAYDSSTVTVSGGYLDWELRAYDSSTITMSGGAVLWDVSAAGSSTITISGGIVDAGSVYALGSSSIRIVGTDFEIDGVPVPYGDLSAQTGTLTGTLASGAPIITVLYQGGWTEGPCSVEFPCSGTITLAPRRFNTPTLAPEWQLILVTVLIGTGLSLRRWRAAPRHPWRPRQGSKRSLRVNL